MLGVPGNVSNKMANVNGSTAVMGGNGKINAVSTASGSPLDALPKQFVLSMKTLFDILDDQRTGFVKFSDIEKGWQDDGCKGLPRGVIDSLRKVTPASGLLSFERFCAGLKLCLLKNQQQHEKSGGGGGGIVIGCGHRSGGNKRETYLGHKQQSPLKSSRPPSAPALEIESPTPIGLWSGSGQNHNTTTVRAHTILAGQRTLSLPQLSPDSSELDTEVAAVTTMTAYNSPPPPPKPPRASATAAAAAAAAANASSNGCLAPGPTPMDKSGIRHALQNWQMGILLNEMEGEKDKLKSSPYAYDQFVSYRGCADGGSSSATDSAQITPPHVGAKKASSRRREPRRHTLQNGIDYNMLKRLKQFEEEREVLLLGLGAVEKARSWYLQQLANVQEKIKYFGRMGTHVEQWSEVQQERLSFQRARILEVNRNLTSLTDSWERGGFPLQHFNLAIRSPCKSSNRAVVAAGVTADEDGGKLGLTPAPPPLPHAPMDRLHQQNRHLINEVNLKSDRISLLEREKQILMREMFDLKQRVGGLNGRSSGFMLSQSSPVCSSSSASGGLGDADVVY